MGLVDKFRYRELRQELITLTEGKWHTYYVGNLAVGKKYSHDAVLIARLVRGLQVSGRVFTCLKRNDEGIMEYRLFTREKLKSEDLDAAMALTDKKGDAYVPPLEEE